MQIKGVDLSYCQEGIDYSALKAGGVKYALIRAGILYSEDKVFADHVKGCRAAGIDVGYYWFSHAKTVDMARKEAAACLKAIGKFSVPTYPVFFDGEDNSISATVGRKAMTDIALAFVEEIEKGGYPCGIYANPDWVENRYEKDRIVGKVDIWLAHWTFNPEKKSKYEYGQTVWQWGLERYGKFEVDADLCFVDYPVITEEWYLNPIHGGAPVEKTVEELAVEVLNGIWGNGVDRKQRLINAGYDYDAVQAEVNRILSASAKKPIDEIAVEVVRGLWGVGEDRKQRLAAAGYDYAVVQAKVNQLIRQ